MWFIKILKVRPAFSLLAVKPRFLTSQANISEKSIDLYQQQYERDAWTNLTPKIVSHLDRNLHLRHNHPLCTIRKKIVKYFYGAYLSPRGNPLFSVYDNLPPVVTTEQNFDNLLIPKDHPSRAKSDCYYINKDHLLRAHTTAHQVELIQAGLDNFLVVGDVYRRDEIDGTHYPVFHQMDGVRIIHQDKLFERTPELKVFETSYKTHLSQDTSAISACIDQQKQPCHTLEAVKLCEHEMKRTLVGMVKELFGDKIQYRWVETYFPFTQPSWELEIYFNNNWLEILGCGITRNEILERSGVDNSIAYAFGVGLERLAMVLFDIPDIRLFWSTDSGFLNQFKDDKIVKYKPISVYPQCVNDLSFWLPEDLSIETFSVNDFYDMVRNVGGEVVEQVTLIDKFKHPKSGKSSLCFRIVYRHMERTLTQAEVNVIHAKIGAEMVKDFNVVIR
ncbi:probable phenylalanine--tRNA ligase, mitochondrial [Culex pipiens pallens]|uniref:probable phenylalanine--tRNA ligase, mitochondrial n=1 Tax=Culex pipiens pallens TaxID=42434 RepID=UPI0022AA60EB|nr:probable phenylalanine--tRNA ligase, mitochondrial [Culex pipiens pallens]